MHFRPAIAADAARISSLIQTLAPGFLLSPDGSGAEQFWASVSEAAEAGYIANPRYRYTVAVCGDELAGFIAMRDTSHVFHLFVAPNFQGKGLASRLWARAREHAAQVGHSGAFTVNASLAAMPVYAHFGFQPTGPVVQMHGIAFQAMCLPAAPE